MVMPAAAESGAPRVPASAAPGGDGSMDRFTWGIVAGIAILVIGGLAGVALLQRQAAPPDLTRPEGVVRAFVEKVDAGQADRAWDLLATAARADVTREEFLRRATNLAQRPPSRVAIEGVTVDGEAARVTISRTFSGTGAFAPLAATERTTVRLVREQGAWRIEVPPDPWLVSRDPRDMP